MQDASVTSTHLLLHAVSIQSGMTTVATFFKMQAKWRYCASRTVSACAVRRTAMQNMLLNAIWRCVRLQNQLSGWRCSLSCRDNQPAGTCRLCAKKTQATAQCHTAQPSYERLAKTEDAQGKQGISVCGNVWFLFDRSWPAKLGCSR